MANATIFGGIPVDGSGNLATGGEGTPGSAAPAQAVQVAGTDGTNLRAVSVAANGYLSAYAIGNNNLSPGGAPGSAAPGAAWLVGGADGTNMRSLLGASTPFFNDAVGAAVQVKATQGVLSALSLVNTTAAAAYLQIFFKPLASVTLGTTAPDFVIRLNASAATVLPLPAPMGFAGTGLTVAGTTTPTGAVVAAISVSAAFQ